MAQAARCFSTAAILQPLAKRSIIDNRPTLLIYTEKKKCLVIIFEQTAYEIFLRQSLFIICIFYTVCFSGPCFCVPLKCIQRAALWRRRECKYEHTLVYFLLFKCGQNAHKTCLYEGINDIYTQEDRRGHKGKIKNIIFGPCNSRLCCILTRRNMSCVSPKLNIHFVPC